MKNTILTLTFTTAILGAALTASRADILPDDIISTIGTIVHALPCWDCLTH